MFIPRQIFTPIIKLVNEPLTGHEDNTYTHAYPERVVFLCARTHTHTLLTTTEHRAQELQGRHRNLFCFSFHLSSVQCLLTLLSSHENIHNLNHNIPQSRVKHNTRNTKFLTTSPHKLMSSTEGWNNWRHVRNSRDVAGFDLHSQYIVQPSSDEKD